MTSDGTVSGTPCKLTIDGVEALRNSYAGQTVPSADGTPQTVAFLVGTKGRALAVKIDFLPKAVFDLLVGEINNSIATNTAITLIGTGDFGNFNLGAVPTLPEPITSGGEFSNSMLKNITFNFTTAS